MSIPSSELMNFYAAIKAGDETRVTALLESGIEPGIPISIDFGVRGEENSVFFPLAIALQYKMTKIARILRNALQNKPIPPNLLNQFTAIKMMGHLLGVPAKISIDTTGLKSNAKIEVASWGTWDYFAFSLLNPVLKQYLDSLPEKTNLKSDFNEIYDAFAVGLQFLSLEEDYVDGISRLLTRFKQNKPIILPSGNNQHSVGVGLYKNRFGQAYLIFANRGLGKEYEQGGTLIYKVKDPVDNFVTEQFLLELFLVNNQVDIKDCVDLVRSVVVADPIILPSKAQELGNCAVVNAKSVQEGFLFLFEHARRLTQEKGKGRSDVKEGMETKLNQESQWIEESKEYAEKSYKTCTQAYRDIVVDKLLASYQEAVVKENANPNEPLYKKDTAFYLDIFYHIIKEHHGKEKYHSLVRKTGRMPKLKAELKRAERILKSINPKERKGFLERLETEGATASLVFSAKKYGEESLVKIFMESGTPLMQKILQNDEAGFRKLIAELSAEEVHALLLSGIENINLDLVNSTLNCQSGRVQIDKADGEGNTALFRAVKLWGRGLAEGNKLKKEKREEAFRIIQTLLKMGANPLLRGKLTDTFPWLKNKFGKITPLHMAVMNYIEATEEHETHECLELIKMLASFGIDTEDLKEVDFYLRIPKDFEFTQAILSAKNLSEILNFQVFESSIFQLVYDQCYKDERYIDLINKCLIPEINLNHYLPSETYLGRAIDTGNIKLLQILTKHPRIIDFINQSLTQEMRTVPLPLELVADIMSNPDHTKIANEMLTILLEAGADPFINAAWKPSKAGVNVIEDQHLKGNDQFVQSMLNVRFSPLLLNNYKKQFYPELCDQSESKLFEESNLVDSLNGIAEQRVKSLYPMNLVLSAEPPKNLVKLVFYFLKRENQLEDMAQKLERLCEQYTVAGNKPWIQVEIRLKFTILNQLFDEFSNEKLQNEKMVSIVSELAISQGETLELTKKMVKEKFRLALDKSEGQYKRAREIIFPESVKKLQPGS